MPRIRLKGNVVNFETACGAKPEGRCVVMLHGAGQSALCWENQISALSDYTRFPSVALDLPGHGGSGGGAMASMENYARFVAGFCRQAGISSPILIGHSMGGRIAQLLAPGGAVKPFACMLVATGTRIRVSRWSMKTVQKDYQTFCKMAARNAFGEKAPRHIREVFLKRLLDTPSETVHRDLLACDGFDSSDSMEHVDIPTVIVAGENDVLTPARHTDGLRRSVPGSKLFTVKDAGHFMMMEKPEEFNKIMLDFLNLL